MSVFLNISESNYRAILYALCDSLLLSRKCLARPEHSLNAVATPKAGVLFFSLERCSLLGLPCFCSHISFSLEVISGGASLAFHLRLFNMQEYLLLPRLRI